MLEYKYFKEIAKEKVMEYLPPELQERGLIFSTTEKVNTTYDALTLTNIGIPGEAVPAINMNLMYDSYVRTGDLDQVCERAANTMQEALNTAKNIRINFDMDFEGVKDKICYKLVNREANAELLEHVPNTPYLDLNYVYYIVVENNEDCLQTCLIKDGMAEKLGVTTEQLHSIAQENTRKMFPEKILEMRAVLMELYDSKGIELDDEELQDLQQEDFNNMIVISSTRGKNGAVLMTDPEVRQQVFDKIGGDFYMCFSSIHECIAMPTSSMDPDTFAVVVHDVNMCNVDLCERLSNQVYYGNAKENTLTCATNTIYKSIKEDRDVSVFRRTEPKMSI